MRPFVLFLLLACTLASFVVCSSVKNAAVSSSAKNSGRDGKKMQLINFFAGGAAGMVSSTITTPLEVVKTQLQSSTVSVRSPLKVAQMVLAREGVSGLFKGIKPMLVGIIPTRAIYFWSYSTSKSKIKEWQGGKENALTHLCSAMTAGITSNTIMNPVWMLKTRFQIMADTSKGQQDFKNYMDLIKAVYKEEGLGGFWKGLSASYVGCFEGAIQWIVYEKIKAVSKDQRTATLQASSTDKQGKNVKVDVEDKPLAPGTIFLQAAFAKAIAIVATYPHEVVRTRLREQATSGTFKYTGFMQTLNMIAKEEGRKGLYGGMDIHLFRSVPNAAIMFLSYELMAGYLETAVDKFQAYKEGLQEKSAGKGNK